MYTVVEINKLSRLKQLRYAWRHLWEQSTNASFFASYEWFQDFMSRFGDDVPLRILCVMDDEQPIGIVPLVQHEVDSEFGRAVALTYPANDWGHSSDRSRPIRKQRCESLWSISLKRTAIGI